MALSIPHLLQKKRDGFVLSDEEIHLFVQSVVDGAIQDSQIGAMLMAIYLKGLNMKESIALTRSMTYTGEILTFPEEWGPLIVDKHSTGGVGDKVSLILAPTLAALGFKVPMMSGRGLGFTGGTLDKLESIPGFKTKLTNQEMTNCLAEAGCFIAGATARLAPADAILYQQRDVTSTIDCLPLVVSSILSKKVAEGTKTLVMDVKVGRGSFFQTEEISRQFAGMLVEISKGLGVTTKAVLSRMEHPIGVTVGNSVEVEEALECLKGRGPSDTLQLVHTCAAVLLLAKGSCSNLEDGIELVSKQLQNGRALEHFYKMLICQGVQVGHAKGLCYGDHQSYSEILPQPKYKTTLSIKSKGYISSIDALSIATVCWKLGAGRNKASDSVDHSVGVRLLKTCGDFADISEPWVEVLHSEPQLTPESILQLEQCVQISEEPPNIPSLIIDII